ncbi:unnamed protein product [Gadus morhua 'NCC']
MDEGPSAPLSRGPSAPLSPLSHPLPLSRVVSATHCPGSCGLSEVLQGIVSAPEDGWQGASHCPLDLGQAAAERLADVHYTHMHYADVHYSQV